ncbi:MAG: glycoside hydrolase [Clostridia bacterium]|nr:glycoside hydrolase [Clostridia bacterium]
MKLCVIGGAGVRTVSFINGLVSHRGRLRVEQVSLWDTDRRKLEVISGLCRHVADRAGSPLRVEAAASAEEALSGAGAVVTTLRVGGDRGRAMDETIALRRGVIGQETTGAGGFFMAARTLPVLLGYMELTERLAPGAAVFNFTNPSGLVTQALAMAGHGGVLGICDAPSSVSVRMAEALGVPEDRLEARFFGLNHLSWIHSVRVNGEERLPALLRDRDFLSSVQEFSIFDPGCFRLSGCLPNEYLYYYYHRERALERMMGAKELRGAMIERLDRELFASVGPELVRRDPEEALQRFLYFIWKREGSYMSAETSRAPREAAGGRLEIPKDMGYAGVMLGCLEAMQGEAPRVLALNVPNGGAIPCLGDEDIVEISCEVSSRGIRPLPPPEVNAHCEDLLRSVKAYERAAAGAILEGSRERAVEALTLHPLVMSWSLASALVDDCRAAWGDAVRLD